MLADVILKDPPPHGCPPRTPLSNPDYIFGRGNILIYIDRRSKDANPSHTTSNTKITLFIHLFISL